MIESHTSVFQFNVICTVNGCKKKKSGESGQEKLSRWAIANDCRCSVSGALNNCNGDNRSYFRSEVVLADWDKRAASSHRPLQESILIISKEISTPFSCLHLSRKAMKWSRKCLREAWEPFTRQFPAPQFPTAYNFLFVAKIVSSASRLLVRSWLPSSAKR